MGNVDFVQSNNNKPDSNGSQFDVEYTNPDPKLFEKLANKPKKSFWSFLKRKPATAPRLKLDVKGKQASGDQPVVDFAEKPKAKKSHRSVNNTTTNQTAPPLDDIQKNVLAPEIQAMPLTSTPQTPVAKPQQIVIPQQPLANKSKVKPKSKPKKIPTPPLPPIHAAPLPTNQPPVQPLTQPAPQPLSAPSAPVEPAVVAPETQEHINHQAAVAEQPEQAQLAKPLAKTIPVAPMAPLASAPKATVAGAGPTETNKTGAIHAQRVTTFSGKETNPEELPDAPFVVNLLPEDLVKKLTPTSYWYRLMKLSLTVVLGVGGVYGAMIGYQSYFLIQTRQSQLEIERLQKEIIQYKTLQNDINITDTKITQLHNVLDQHVYWTNLLAMLEQYTLPTVTYATFSAGSVGQVTLQATTTDFATVTQQVEVFKSASEVLSVNVTNASRASAPAPTETLEGDQPQQETITETTEDNTEAELAQLQDAPVSFAITLQISPDVLYYDESSQ